MVRYVGNEKPKLGLVLSGGGSKGAYEIGACIALHRLGKKPSVVTGTSIGAINGLFVVQKNIRKALRLWKSISFSKVYDEDSFPVCENSDLTDIYKLYAKSFITEGGMDIGRIKAMFDTVYSPKKFFSSPIDYGLVTFNLSSNRPVFMTKADLKPDTVKDYVLASASCYPAFKPYKIGDNLFIDGGYYDNLPINLAIQLGAEEIIAIDLRAVGFKRPNEKDVPITIISPRNKIVSFLVFDSVRSREAVKFGYNDVMKTYGVYDGNEFTFKKNNLIKNYNKYGEKFLDKAYSLMEGIDEGILGKIVSSSIFQSIVKDKLTYKNFNRLVEKAGFCFDFPEDNVYNIKTYNKGLLNELFKVTAINLQEIGVKIKNRKFKEIVDVRPIIRLFYDAIAGNDVRSVVAFLPMFADEFLIALYLYVLKKSYHSIY